MWTVLQAIVWFGVFTLIFQFHPWHALGLGIATMLLVQGLATMGVNSILTPTPASVSRPASAVRQAGPPVPGAAPGEPPRPSRRRLPKPSEPSVVECRSRNIALRTSTQHTAIVSPQCTASQEKPMTIRGLLGILDTREETGGRSILQPSPFCSEQVRLHRHQSHALVREGIDHEVFDSPVRPSGNARASEALAGPRRDSMRARSRSMTDGIPRIAVRVAPGEAVEAELHHRCRRA